MSKSKAVWPFKRITPMTACGNGQWRRIHDGKAYYFGRIDDPRAALQRWKLEWPGIERGEGTGHRAAAFDATVHDVCTRFIESCKASVDRGLLSPRTLKAYGEVTLRLVYMFGEETAIDGLTPRSFADALDKISKAWGVHWRTNFVVYTRRIFKWAFESQLIGEIPKYGPDFKSTPRAVMRRHRQATKRTRLTADDVILLIASAQPVVRLMVILGISVGFGPTDIATLLVADCDLRAGVVNYQRHKTSIPRVAPLWPHAIDLMRKIIRPGQKLVFVQEHGAPFNDERVMKAFRRLADSLLIDATFYDLRRTFATVANGARDKDAARVIMGQRVESVFDDYVQDDSPVPLARLVAVSDFVRAWLRLPHPGDQPIKP